MEIEIESRESITARASEPFPAHTALISIADSDHDFAKLENQPEYLLQMRFDDVTEELFDVAKDSILENILGRKPTEAEALALAKNFHMFSDEQAKEIVAFVESVFGKADILICQCEYGQSRSAGIAAAVRQSLYGDGIDIFADERYFPNKLVYRRIMENNASLKMHL